MSTPSPRSHRFNVVLQGIVSDLRVEVDQLSRLYNYAHSLIEESDHKEQIYGVAGPAVKGIPDGMGKVQDLVAKLAYVISVLDSNMIKSTFPSSEMDALMDSLTLRKLSCVVADEFVKARDNLSEGAYVEFTRQDVFATVDEFIDAMPPAIQAIHVRTASSGIRYAIIGVEGRYHYAIKLEDILSRVSSVVKSRAKKTRIRLKRAMPKINRWIFEARTPGSEFGPHTVRVLAVPKDKRIKTVAASDIFLSCSCKSWVYDGPEYHAKTMGYLEGRPSGAATRPDVRDPAGKKLLCKHVIAVSEKLKNYPVAPKR